MTIQRRVTLEELESWLTTTQVARLLNLSQQRILQMADDDDLGDVVYSPHGRLFDPAAIEAVRKAREQ